MMIRNQTSDSLRSIVGTFQKSTIGMECTGVSGAERAHIVFSAYMQLKAPVFVIAAGVKEGEQFLSDLRFFSGKASPPLLFFPPYTISPFKPLSYQGETAAKRINILYTLMERSTPPIVVIPVDALLQKLVPKKEIRDFAELIMKAEEIDLDQLVGKLIAGGYTRASIVEEPGDFSVRGGIVDIFSPMYADPLRIELFGDMVDSLRIFSAVNQRKISDISEAVLLPAREAILKKERLDQVLNRMRERASHLGLSRTAVREFVDRIKNEGVFPGIESLMPLVYPQLDTFFDYIPEHSLLVLLEPSSLKAAAAELENQASNIFMTACTEKKMCVEPEHLYMSWQEVEANVLKKKALRFNLLPVFPAPSAAPLPLPQLGVSVEDNTAISMELSGLMGRENPLQPLADWIEDKRGSGYITLVVCSTPSQVDRIRSLLEQYRIDIRPTDGFPGVSREVRWDKGPVYGCLGQLSSGFVWPEQALAIITEDEIFGQKHRRKKVARKSLRAELLAVEDLKKGDLIVHSEHGIGQYLGLEKLIFDGIANDFILIVYKDDDKLYLPVDRMNMAKKYIGVDGILPILDKMGGKSWERVKQSAKKSVEKIAGELLKLYADRKVKKGHAFSKADRYFRDFEAGFHYEETTDQLKAIDDVLTDMEQPLPMDRLICGDVGYGKTEVALRAAFKAVSDSKQVAILVPTTVLAEQHFKTFSERFEKYPINISCLNRFRSDKEQRSIVEEIKQGKVDVVIGTHRLLQKDVEFKALGLIIIDEEQRFGVTHKERLKKLRSTVDVLALTATPIPRTLHMSLVGARDISVISTPPEDRHAIITYISEYDDGVVKDAIRKEVSRKGQVFFIHNNIHSIWKIAKHLMSLLPEVRIGVAHGRLKEDELEEVMLKFINKEIDMLVCTTIVESGLDISSANTILVNHADRFGLAQIYQLRGRVGRSDEQAYAYLFIPKDSALTADAKKRLKVLMEYSDLGSGFQIAMSDLQIRGGGTILGAAQSGKIAAVGYDMFLELMERAVSELKGEPAIDALDPEVNVPMSTFIPESYVPDIDQRLSAYRRLAKMTELKEITLFKEDLIDRYGKLPTEAANLLLKIMLKILSVKAGVKKLDLNTDSLVIAFSEVHQQRPFGIVQMIASQPDRYKFTPDHVLKVKLPKLSPNASLALTKNILKEIAQHVNG